MTGIKLEQDIGGLAALSRRDLVERWAELYGSAPLKTLTPDLLIRGIAYAMQERQFGGLRPTEMKTLTALAEGIGTPKPSSLKNGTRLYRSWQGVTHEVLVLEQGYGWQGKTYASLSEAARAITGTRWSGPRFFGLEA